MRLTINYGVEREIERVFYTLHKYEWYCEQGYKVFLPEGVDIHSTKEEVHQRIREVYAPVAYEGRGRDLQEEFQKYSNYFSTALKAVFSNVPEQIILILTKYGVGGSYGLPNQVLFNIQYKVGIENLFHEIVHLCIEPYIKRYKIRHWEKERIVDLILHSEEFAFLNYQKWQKDYRGVEKRVDELFHTYFPGNLERLFVEISG